MVHFSSTSRHPPIQARRERVGKNLGQPRTQHSHAARDPESPVPKYTLTSPGCHQRFVTLGGLGPGDTHTLRWRCACGAVFFAAQNGQCRTAGRVDGSHCRPMASHGSLQLHHRHRLMGTFHVGPENLRSVVNPDECKNDRRKL
jgi:hypothetical protein